MLMRKLRDLRLLIPNKQLEDCGIDFSKVFEFNSNEKFNHF